MLTRHEQKIVYEALLHHDGHSLMPEWNSQIRKTLTLALDKLRLEIRPGPGPDHPLKPVFKNTPKRLRSKWIQKYGKSEKC
ncbi:MAG: hypothetical protein WC799_19765 [Desulfobacteraceae bacterium]|jgi:hypothetical protein